MSTTINDQIRAIQNNTNLVRAENADPGNTQLGQQSFLTLLVEQLKNQDPTNPSDSAQMAVQLAQFTQVEQLTQLNEGIGNLTSTQESTTAGLINTMAASLAGKEVKIAKDSIQHEGGARDINFSLQSRATDVRVQMVNSLGNVVAEIDAGGFPAGEHTFKWDGLTSEGQRVPAGEYQINIAASDGEAPVQAEHYIRGRIDSLKYDPSGVLLNVNGEFINMSNVMEILSPSN